MSRGEALSGFGKRAANGSVIERVSELVNGNAGIQDSLPFTVKILPPPRLSNELFETLNRCVLLL